VNLLRNEIDRDRLFNAITISYQKLERFRELRNRLIQDYAGSNYGEPTRVGNKTTMLNLQHQAVEAYTMALAANRPRVTVDTNHQNLKFFSKLYAVALNNMIQEMNLERVIQRWVTDAFFSMGIIKVHMAETESIELWDGVWLDPGTPMASNVSMDDFVFDISVKRWDQIKYAADSYRIPFDQLKSDVFDQKVVANLQPTSKLSFGGHPERAELMSKGYECDFDEIEPMIDLMDVWIPRENRVYTFPMDPVRRFQGKGQVLAVLDWDGDAEGVYRKLSFYDVPDNIMPAAPAAIFEALGVLVNDLLRKQARQAKRQKEINIYTQTGKDDAGRVSKAVDGEWIAVNDTKELGVIKRGGVDAANQAFAVGAIDLFDRMAGNLPAKLGLGPQAQTLGQEEIIAGKVTSKEAQMRLRVLEATRGLIRCLGLMLWNDAVKQIPGRMPVPGVDGASIDATWTPELRQGHFYDYDLDIDVYSMAYRSPMERANTIHALLDRTYIPAGQMVAQQGGSINFKALAEMDAEFLDEPRFSDIVQFFNPPAAAQEGETGGPPETTRNYVRRNVAGGATPGAQSTQTQSDWLARAEQAPAETPIAAGGGM